MKLHRYRDEKLNDSIKNRKNLIPSDYNDRVSALLSGLPDELPDSENTDAVVIRRSARFDIKPFVSAAAAFAVIAAGLLAFPNLSKTADRKSDDSSNNNKVTTAPSVTEETTVSTVTTVSTSVLNEVSSVTEGSETEQKIITGDITESGHLAVPPVTEITEVKVTRPNDSSSNNNKNNNNSTSEETGVHMPEPAVTAVVTPAPAESDRPEHPKPEAPVSPAPPVSHPAEEVRPDPVRPEENHAKEDKEDKHPVVTPWEHGANPYHPEVKNSGPVQPGKEHPDVAAPKAERDK